MNNEKVTKEKTAEEILQKVKEILFPHQETVRMNCSSYHLLFALVRNISRSRINVFGEERRRKKVWRNAQKHENNFVQNDEKKRLGLSLVTK